MIISMRKSKVLAKDVSKELGLSDSHIRINLDKIDIPPGSCATVVGENGAGKTTILRLVAGAISVDSGEIDKSPLQIAFTDIERQFNHRLSTFQNLRYVRGLFGAKKVRPEELDTILEEVGLASHTSSLVATLSKGQKTRLAMAVISSEEWSRIIVDEPTNGLDAEGKKIVIDTLKRSKLSGSSVLLSTHDLELIQSVSETLVLKNSNGKFVQLNTKDCQIEAAFLVKFSNGTTSNIEMAELPSMVKTRGNDILSITTNGQMFSAPETGPNL